MCFLSFSIKGFQLQQGSGGQIVSLVMSWVQENFYGGRGWEEGARRFVSL